jgi:hypothetical protein
MLGPGSSSIAYTMRVVRRTKGPATAITWGFFMDRVYGAPVASFVERCTPTTNTW